MAEGSLSRTASMSPPMLGATKRLDLLPEEIISDIAVKLHADDVAAFRLTSRSLEQKSFHEFATQYFAEKCFMFSTDSLKVLLNIANDTRLGSYLHHIHFMTAVFSSNVFHNACHCTWSPSTKKQEAYQDYVNDQKELTKSGRDKQILMDAFAKLHNLTTISINDSPTQLGADIDYRGNNKVFRLTGRPPMLGAAAASQADLKEYQAFFKHVWQVVVQAVEKVPHLKRFGLHLTKGSDGVPVTFLDTKKIRQSLPALRELEMLRLRIRGPSRCNNGTSAEKRTASSQEVKILKGFSEALPSLEMLHLAFDSTEVTGSYLKALSLGLDLRKLASLHLDGVCIAVAQLATIVNQLRSMKDVQFTFINLTKGTWVTILKILQGMTSHLKHLHLMFLLEAGQKAYFLKQLDLDTTSPFFDDGAFGGSDYSDEPETDDDLPPLEPGDLALQMEEDVLSMLSGPAGGSELPEEGDSNLPTLVSPTSVQAGASNANSHSNADHVQPGLPVTGERGYFVCVQGDEVAAQLPTFIKEYNLGENVHDDLPPGGAFGAAGGPANFNTFMNMVGAALGVPPPAPAAGGAAAAAAVTGGGPGPAPGAGTGHAGGHAAGAGFIPMGNGGYVGFGAFPVAGPAPPSNVNAIPTGGAAANGGGAGSAAAAGSSAAATAAAGWADADADMWEDEDGDEGSEDDGCVD